MAKYVTEFVLVEWCSHFSSSEGKSQSPWLLNWFDEQFGGYEKFQELWMKVCQAVLLVLL